MTNLKLPSYIPPTQPAKRPSATTVNRVKTTEQKLTVAGYNELVPIVYGRVDVSGPMIAGPVVKNGWAYFAIGLSVGPINLFEKIKIGSDEHDVTGVNQTVTGDKVTYQLTFYDGTQTNVDPNLIEGIEFFGDTFNGVAYVSVKAQGENFNLSNGISFIIQGRKVLDPRDNVVKYTENPALHLNDMVTNGLFGLNRDIYGISEVADYCDSSFGGAPLARTGLSIQTVMSEDSLLDMLAMYAECIWGYDGNGIYVIPDKEVPEEEIIDIKPEYIRDGSLQLFTDGADDTPTSVTVTYNSDEADGLAGAPVFVTRGESTASTPVMNSSVNLPGVFRRTEAQRRAEQRLARLQIPGKVSFQMFDIGGELKVGQVVRFPDYAGMGGVLLRIMAQPDMVSPGLWQLHTEIYDASIYHPSEGLGAVVIPKGGVVPFLLGSLIPTGFSDTSGWGGCFIAGSSNIESASMHEAHYPEIINDVAKTSIAGGHKPNTTTMANLNPESGWPDTVAARNEDRGAHNHDVFISFEPNDALLIGHIETRWVIANDDVVIPYGVGFLHTNRLTTTSYVDQPGLRGFSVAGSGQTSTVNSSPLILRTSLDGKHNHTRRAVSPEWGFRPVTTTTGGSTTGVLSGEQGEHRHNVEATVELNLRAASLHIHSMTVQGGSLPSGAIIGFIGESVPDKWGLCNGQNGTIDLTDFFIGFGDHEIKDIDNQTVTLSIDGTASGGAHTHTTSRSYATRSGGYSNHTADHPVHRHEINYERTVPFIPRHIKLAFIQYIGE